MAKILDNFRHRLDVVYSIYNILYDIYIFCHIFSFSFFVEKCKTVSAFVLSGDAPVVTISLFVLRPQRNR